MILRFARLADDNYEENMIKYQTKYCGVFMDNRVEFVCELKEVYKRSKDMLEMMSEDMRLKMESINEASNLGIKEDKERLKSGRFQW
jgi:hypothetical protein